MSNLPINRLVMLRTRGLYGPVAQPIGDGRLVHAAAHRGNLTVYPPISAECQSRWQYAQDVSETRTNPLNVAGVDGTVAVPAGLPAFDGAYYGLDPAHVFFRGWINTKGVGTAFRLIGATHRFRFSPLSGVGAVTFPEYASSVSPSPIPEYTAIEWATDSPTTITNINCSNVSLNGTYPDYPRFPNLTQILIRGNSFTGAPPTLDNCLALTRYVLGTTLSPIQGPLPRVAFNPLLTDYSASNVGASGEVPSFFGNTALVAGSAGVIIPSNLLTALEPGWTWPTGRVFIFDLRYNMLPMAVVDQILVSANTQVPGSCSGMNIKLEGDDNAYPSSLGIDAANALISRGALITLPTLP